MKGEQQAHQAQVMVTMKVTDKNMIYSLEFDVEFDLIQMQIDQQDFR